LICGFIYVRNQRDWCGNEFGSQKQKRKKSMTIKRILIGACAGLLLFTTGYTLRGVKKGHYDFLPSAQA